MNSQRVERAQIGGRLRDARCRARVSVEDAAKAANVQPLAVKKWEKGGSLPSLLEFRELLPLYGVMACQVLFEDSPIELSREQAAELARAPLSPALRLKVDVLLAMLARAREPVWKAELPPQERAGRL
jgi:transcriptional regulator with XRE-family HTH domain